MKPKELIKEWVKIFNMGDAEKIAELYHDDAINHQIPNELIKGKTAIEKMFAEEFAAVDMVCIEENIFEDGEWAILEWKDPQGFIEEVKEMIFSLGGTGLSMARLSLITIRDNSGLIAADVAEQNGHKEIGQLLRSEQGRIEFFE